MKECFEPIALGVAGWEVVGIDIDGLVEDRVERKSVSLFVDIGRNRLAVRGRQTVGWIAGTKHLLANFAEGPGDLLAAWVAQHTAVVVAAPAAAAAAAAAGANA